LANALGCSGMTPEWIFQTPVVLKGPSITVKTAFISSCTYYLIRNPHGWFSYGTDTFLSHEQAKTCIWLIWVTVLTSHELFKVGDPTLPLTNLVGKLFLCDSKIGAAPEDGIYEKFFGKHGMTGEDSALSGFGFVKKPRNHKADNTHTPSAKDKSQ